MVVEAIDPYRARSGLTAAELGGLLAGQPAPVVWLSYARSGEAALTGARPTKRALAARMGLSRVESSVSHVGTAVSRAGGGSGVPGGGVGAGGKGGRAMSAISECRSFVFDLEALVFECARQAAGCWTA